MKLVMVADHTWECADIEDAEAQLVGAIVDDYSNRRWGGVYLDGEEVPVEITVRLMTPERRALPPLSDTSTRPMV